MSEQRWSVVLTQFVGGWERGKALDEAAWRIFGRRGLDAYGLVCGRDTLPAEVASFLAHEDAVLVADALRELGGKAEVVSLSDVGAVRYRADDIWASHVVNDMAFTEIDGMIFAAPALNVRRNLAVLHLQQSNLHQSKWSAWKYERVLNCLYADASHTDLAPRVCVREEVALAVNVESTLRMAYPNIGFVLSHIIGEGVTFYQAGADAPMTDTLPAENKHTTVWCVHCDQQQPYSRCAESDPEFNNALWGYCSVCGREVLVASGMMRRLVGPPPSF